MPYEGAVYVALVIFAITYVLISLRTIRKVPLERPATALLGAALMIAFGIVSVGEVVGGNGNVPAINLDVILLLLGMMLLVGGLELVGFFDLVSMELIKRSSTPLGFLSLLMVITAVLSALVLNDTVVLLFTPVVIKSCRTLRVNPVPYLVGEAIAANVGSVATEVGNPQNAFIAIESGIPFAMYTAILLPVTALCLAVSILLMRFIYKRDLGTDPLVVTATNGGIARRVHKPSLYFLLTVLLGVVVAFLLAPHSYLALVAFSGGAIATFLLPAFGVASARDVLKKVDWSILIFFIGLFIVLKGVQVSGLLDRIIGAFGFVSGGNIQSVGWLSAISAVLSNLISNVPAVLLLAPIAGQADPRMRTILWLTLAASSTLAGNATILGAAANVIVVQKASSDGVEVKLRDFMKSGIPITIATLILASGMLHGFFILGLV